MSHNYTQNKELKRKKGLNIKKALMIKNIIKNMGVITRAARETGIERKTHYNWLKNDTVYREKCEDAIEDMKDIIEYAFLQLVLKGNPSAVIHAAKTRLRHRGYGY